MASVTIAVYEKMNDSKEAEALCNNVQNHRQQLLNHQQEIDRDLEAGSCNDEDDDETREEGEGEEGEEGEEREDGERKIQEQEIPAIYNVEPGCTALGCYSAIITFIVMIFGIVALLIHSSPPNARAANFNGTEGFNLSAIKPPPPPPPPLTTLAPDLFE